MLVAAVANQTTGFAAKTDGVAKEDQGKEVGEVEELINEVMGSDTEPQEGIMSAEEPSSSGDGAPVAVDGSPSTRPLDGGDQDAHVAESTADVVAVAPMITQADDVLLHRLSKVASLSVAELAEAEMQDVVAEEMQAGHIPGAFGTSNSSAAMVNAMAASNGSARTFSQSRASMKRLSYGDGGLPARHSIFGGHFFSGDDAVHVPARSRARQLYVEAGAGQGKTRLAVSALEKAHEAGLAIITGAADHMKRGRTLGVFEPLLMKVGPPTTELSLFPQPHCPAAGTGSWGCCSIHRMLQTPCC